MFFVPGNRERFLAKARELHADALVRTWRAASWSPRKGLARQMVRDAPLPDLAASGQKIIVRVNPLESPYVYNS